MTNPIFLLADSQLLFHNNGGGLLLQRVKEIVQDTGTTEIKAAYIGASNNDDPKFFEIFKVAMDQVDIKDVRMIKSNTDNEDVEFLNSADIILLAGGDTRKGWDVIKRNGWDKIIIEKYSKGAVLMGVSAGAVHLGLKGCKNNSKNIEKVTSFDTLQLVPFIIDVHANDDWLKLSRQIESENGKIKGYGIPYGAGIICYPDISLEIIRFPCTEIVKNNNEIVKSLILPPNENEKVNKEKKTI